jgi:putative isomerase
VRIVCRVRSLVLGLGIGIAVSIGYAQVNSHVAPGGSEPGPRSAQYEQVQERLARGWNTWDVHSVATQVLLPQGLAIHVGLKHNSTLNGDAYLGDALIGRLDKDAEKVKPGPHSWDGSYTQADFEWKGHRWRIESAHDGDDLVLLVTPLEPKGAALPPTVVFSVNFLWNRFGSTLRLQDRIEASPRGFQPISIYCTCAANPEHSQLDIPVGGPDFAANLTSPVGLGTGRPRSLDEIRTIIAIDKNLYGVSRPEGRDIVIHSGGRWNGPVVNAIQSTIGWDTIYEPERERVISPVSRVWSVGWGGYVLFDWDTFFAATLAGIGDKDLAYANALEILREETAAGFVPNYARAGNWKSSDRSEPPVGAITVLGLYEKFHDRWFTEDAFDPLVKWNRWWAEHRDIHGYLAWGSDGKNQPENLDDSSRGTREGAILESGLDNSPMYDNSTYNAESHVLEYADVGLMSMYIADCDALAKIADVLGKTTEAKELKDRAARYRAKLTTLWDEKTGIFLNKDLHTGQSNTRLSPTNFYPMLAKVATPEQAKTMIEKHLMNPDEFWGEWVIPSIARSDPAFKDQNYWRGRIWGPMNYLVYLGLQNYEDSAARIAFAQKSYELFLKEWKENGHVHENYNAITGSGDDVNSSDRFYHWGALLGYVEYLEQKQDAEIRK